MSNDNEMVTVLYGDHDVYFVELGRLTDSAALARTERARAARPALCSESAATVYGEGGEFGPASPARRSPRLICPH